MQRVIYSEVMAEYRTPGMYNANGIWQIGPMIIAWGTDEQKAALAPQHPRGPRALVPGVLRARRRQRPRQPAHHRHPRRRPLRGERPEDLDLDRPPRQVGPVPAPHRPDGHRAGCQARGDHRLHRRHARRRASSGGRSATCPARRCSTRSSSPTPRLPVDCRLGGEGEGWMVAMGTLGHERVGIAGQISILAADLRAMVEAARTVNPDALEDPHPARPAGQGLDRNRAGAPARAAGPEQDHQGREALARGPVRQARVVAPRPDPRRAGGRPARARPGCSPGAVPTRSTVGSGLGSTRSSATAPSAAARPRCRRTSSPTGPSGSPGRPASPEVRGRGRLADPRVAVHHRGRPADLAPGEVGADGAPEPLDMWEEVGPRRGRRRRCARRTDRAASASRRLLPDVGVRRPGRPTGRTALGARPATAATRGSAARSHRCSPPRPRESILAGELDLALVVGAEALATQRRLKKDGRKPELVASARGARPFPFDTPFHPAEVGPRHLPGVPDLRRSSTTPDAPTWDALLDEHRRRLGRLLAPMSEVAAGDPANAWFPRARSAAEIADGGRPTAWSPTPTPS